MESWKKIKNYENKYLVSNNGRIYVGANIIKRMETKNESSLKMLELINQN